MNQALFTIHLSEYGTASNLPVILAAVLFSLLRQDIFQRSIGAQIEQPNVSVNTFKCREASLCINVCLDIDGFEPLREFPNFRYIIIFFDMLSGTGNGEKIQQFEIVKIQSLQQRLGGSFAVVQIQPRIEACLSHFQRLFYAGDTVGLQRVVFCLNDKSDLVFQIVHPVVYRRRRKHKHFGFNTCFDDPIHQFGIAGQRIIFFGPDCF